MLPWKLPLNVNPGNSMFSSKVVLKPTANVLSPLHKTWSGIASTPTVGFTVITISKVSPSHPLKFGVTE